MESDKSTYSSEESFAYLADDLVLGRLLTIEEVARLDEDALDRVRGEVESELRDEAVMRRLLSDAVAEWLKRVGGLPPGLTIPGPGLAYDDDFPVHHTFLAQFLQQRDIDELTDSQRRVVVAGIKSEILTSKAVLEALTAAARRGIDLES